MGTNPAVAFRTTSVTCQIFSLGGLPLIYGLVPEKFRLESYYKEKRDGREYSANCCIYGGNDLTTGVGVSRHLEQSTRYATLKISGSCRVRAITSVRSLCRLYETRSEHMQRLDSDQLKRI